MHIRSKKMFLLKFKHKTNGNLDPKGELDNIFFFQKSVRYNWNNFLKHFFGRDFYSRSSPFSSQLFPDIEKFKFLKENHDNIGSSSSF